MFDVAIVGGGPVGLVMAIEAHRRGLVPVVFERRTGLIDKACGEGLMPAGVRTLERLGARRWIPDADCAAFTAIRYVQEDGRGVDGELPPPGGLGIRRTALRDALRREADALGIDVREGCGVRDFRRDQQSTIVRTDDGEVRARFVVGADGLHSATREAMGASGPPSAVRRFGLRRHVAMVPWAPRVEVHLASGIEAYVTPAGQERVGVAFLWTDGAVDGPPSFDSLLLRFPALAERIADAPSDSTVRGAGALMQHVRRRTADGVALVGDAAGYVDAITGEGLSLGFAQAALLADVLPRAIVAGGARETLAEYERSSRALFSRYARTAGALLWLARRPALRRFVVNRLIAHPPLFGRVLRAAVGTHD
jgi:flavin-dependent dehydrogenase